MRPKTTPTNVPLGGETHFPEDDELRIKADEDTMEGGVEGTRKRFFP